MLPRILVATDRLPQAQEAVEQLLTKSAGHERLPHALHEIMDQAKASGKTLEVGQIYQSILTARTGQPQAIWLKMGIAIANAHLGSDQAAESALQDIIDHHRSDEHSTEALGQVAWAYRKLDQQDKARRVYQYVVDNWPKRDRTIFSQRGFILCSIALDDQPAASAAVEKLLADYADSKYVPEIVRSIAAEYSRKGKLQQALSLHQYVVDKHPKSDEALWCQRDIAFHYIDAANEQAAEEGLQKLVTSFASNPRLPEALADVGEHYRSRKDFANARNLHQEVVKRFPNSEEAIWSQRNAILSNMNLKDDSQVEAGIETLLTQFAKDNDIVPVLAYVADRLEEGKQAERERLYRYIIDNHPTERYTLQTQRKPVPVGCTGHLSDFFFRFAGFFLGLICSSASTALSNVRAILLLWGFARASRWLLFVMSLSSSDSRPPHVSHSASIVRSFKGIQGRVSDIFPYTKLACPVAILAQFGRMCPYSISICVDGNLLESNFGVSVLALLMSESRICAH
jgi:tetratricopeptide (TPR) repeat protein